MKYEVSYTVNGCQEFCKEVEADSKFKAKQIIFAQLGSKNLTNVEVNHVSE